MTWKASGGGGETSLLKGARSSSVSSISRAPAANASSTLASSNVAAAPQGTVASPGGGENTRASSKGEASAPR